MIVTFLPAALLVLTLICVLATRSRSIAAKLVSEATLLVLIGACLLARGTSPLPTDAELVHGPGAAWLRAIAVIWWLVGARMVATVTVLALGRDAKSRQARLFSDLLAGAIYLTTALIILNSVLELPIKGLLATSGVIAIVLGLALQNTLADVFSGIAVGLEQPFHVGDRITIADHAEGVVVEMNWRSIRIQTDSDDIATIPNSIVARSQIMNRSVPSARRAATIDIPTLSNAPSDRLIELVRHAILLSPAILADPAPGVLIKHVGTRTLTLGVSYHAASTSDLASARSQLLRQVRRLFHHAGVVGDAAISASSLLGGLVLFESLDSAQIDELAGKLVRHTFDIGQSLFEQGSVGRSLFVIRKGVFDINRQDETMGRLTYGRIGPGEYLGEISMMSGDPRPVSVVAVTAAEAFELPRSALEGLLAENKGLSVAIERSVQRGLALLDRDAAARNCHPLDAGGSLIERIRGFLRLSAHA